MSSPHSEQPIEAVVAPPEDALAPSPTDRQKINVLVVDDDEDTRDVLEDILEDAGYSVWTADSGEQAVAMLAETPMDLVLTDMRMPGQDGLDVLEETKRLSPETDVIVMTGYASVDLAVECMKHGASDFITKPFNIDHIRMIADRTLRTKALKRKAAETSDKGE